LFGDIKNNLIELSKIGNIAKQCWLEIPIHYPNVVLDEFIIMPNHLHGLIIINGCRGGVTPPLQQPIKSQTLGQVVAYFKYQTTKKINEIIGMPGNPIWQRNFYDHIIRNDESLERIRNYIINNPLDWNYDKLK